MKQTILLLSIASAILLSCETEIPEVDTTPPRIELFITGPGVDQQLSNPPQAVWTGPSGRVFDLQPNAVYNFSLIVSDQGGVSRAHLRFANDLIIEEVSPSGTTVTSEGISHILSLRGDASNPLTGLAISGRFRTPNRNNLFFPFLSEGDDFGGAARRPNRQFMRVDAAVNTSAP